MMNELERSGRKKTILISISILLVSIHTIYFYHATHPDVETKKLIQQVIRFLLTIGLLVVTYQGKKWARTTSIVLYSLAVIGALVGIIGLETPLAGKIPLIIMALVYAIAVYHFGLSKGFKAFYAYQNAQRTQKLRLH